MMSGKSVFTLIARATTETGGTSLGLRPTSRCHCRIRGPAAMLLREASRIVEQRQFSRKYFLYAPPRARGEPEKSDM
ncbi:hypothetical protein [Rhodopseudomonas sp. P2A-2r]|uniref:hypothetical protein n=1 Tax=unclassified Rhodopseudomonas TaxID=2638247 RepID=UPI00223459EF|nr:hypothetical protein [Rhodopseudomonas sp. P2A-2r]UZE49314.1 hypothetical protein ONR75_00060 [Rhodopseudomonas sp. P2A-2r]